MSNKIPRWYDGHRSGLRLLHRTAHQKLCTKEHHLAETWRLPSRGGSAELQVPRMSRSSRGPVRPALLNAPHPKYRHFHGQVRRLARDTPDRLRPLPGLLRGPARTERRQLLPSVPFRQDLRIARSRPALRSHPRLAANVHGASPCLLTSVIADTPRPDGRGITGPLAGFDISPARFPRALFQKGSS